MNDSPRNYLKGLSVKKIALALVAVSALGLAACQPSSEANEVANTDAAANEAVDDTNAALEAADNALDAMGNAADNAIEAGENAVEAAGEAVENAAE